MTSLIAIVPESELSRPTLTVSPEVSAVAPADVVGLAGLAAAGAERDGRGQNCGGRHEVTPSGSFHRTSLVAERGFRQAQGQRPTMAPQP